MTKVKTSELSGAALDWAVASCEGFTPFTDGDRTFTCILPSEY